MEEEDTKLETPEVLFADREVIRLLQRVVDAVGLRSFASHAGIAHSTVSKLLSGEVTRVNPAIATSLGFRRVSGWAPLDVHEYDAGWIEDALADEGDEDDDRDPPEPETPSGAGRFIQIEE